MINSKKYISWTINTNNNIFGLLLTIYLLFLVIGQISTRIKLIDLNLFQYILIISSIIYIVTSNKEKQKEHSNKKIYHAYIIILSLFGTALVYSKLVEFDRLISIPLLLLIFIILIVSSYILIINQKIKYLLIFLINRTY